jgi:tight adherence protein B
MTGAALALALALLVAPPSPRYRLHTSRRAASGGRVTALLPCMTIVGVALVLVLSVTIAVAAAIVGATLAVRYRRRAARLRRVAESTALQAALDVLVGELRVGAHPVAAIDVAATEVTGPVADSLRAVAARARLGADVAAGLRSVGLRSPLRSHWERLAVCWQLAQTHGLGIATLIRAAPRDIVERERFSARVTAGMAGARTTAAVLAGLPAVGVALGQAIGADPLGFLLSGGIGGGLLIIGVTFICCGLLWSDRITSRALS